MLGENATYEREAKKRAYDQCQAQDALGAVGLNKPISFLDRVKQQSADCVKGAAKYQRMVELIETSAAVQEFIQLVGL